MVCRVNDEVIRGRTGVDVGGTIELVNNDGVGIVDVVDALRGNNPYIRIRVRFPDRMYWGPDVWRVSCEFDLSGVDMELTTQTAGNSRIFTHSHDITIRGAHGLTVSQPSIISGPPGYEARSTFTIDSLSSHPFVFKWDVGGPCENWEPYLKIDGNPEAIQPGENGGTGTTIGTRTQVAAYFKPTETGVFECPGTLTFSIE